MTLLLIYEQLFEIGYWWLIDLGELWKSEQQ